MADYRSTQSIYVPTTCGADDETDTNFPPSNAGVYRSPHRVYKSSGISLNDYVGVDLGSAKEVVAVAVDNINVASCKIRGDSGTLGDGSPDYDSGALTVGENPVEGRYKILHVLSSAETRRYWWVKSNAESTTDGTGIFAVGSIAIIYALTTWPQNPPRVEIQKQAALTPQSVGGGAMPVGVGNRYANIRISPGNMMPTMRTTLHTILGYGEHSVWLIDFNDGTTYNWYFVYRVGDTEIAIPDANLVEMSPGLLLRTVVD